ncbi:MAG: OmpH family outer membrane protein [Chitinophagaceae bacterium]|nr:OmpH family outer membrane protein [Chitinophagaceae bacterium]
MKNFTLGLNVALVIAVAVLFYLHFSAPSAKPATTQSGTQSAASGDFRIAYFEIDSIESHFDYYKEVSSSIQAKAMENNKQLNQLKQAFANKYQELQRAAQSLTQAELNSKQQELAQMERTYQSKEQMLNNEMQDESMKKLQDVKRKITDFLAEYNKSKGYAFILGNNSDAMALYYKDAAYDITSDVIKGLNELYKTKK